MTPQRTCLLPCSTPSRSPLATSKASPGVVQEARPHIHVHQCWHLDICSPSLLGECLLKAGCPRHHTRFPYHWQLLRRRPSEWISLPDLAQHQLERLYCTGEARVQLGNSSSETCVLDLNGCRVESLVFERWRRLTTPDSPEQSPQFFTSWRTYRQIEGRWLKYKEPLALEIEASFKRQQKRFHFALNDEQYVINWVSLSESNLSRGGYRKICRRPQFRSPLEMAPYLRTLPIGELPREPLHHLASPKSAASAVELPASWVPYPQCEGVAQVPLALMDTEYQMVYWMFHQTVTETKFIITNIFRIQNTALWEKYVKCRARLHGKLADECPSGSWDRHLFHGTSKESAHAISRVNFDPALSGKNGVHYGRGTCFAKSAGYSHTFAVPTCCPSATRYMFLAKVLTGRSARGCRDALAPPLLAGGDLVGERFDSCVNSLDNPTIYVIFDNAQCYPYWLIEYQAVASIAF